MRGAEHDKLRPRRLRRPLPPAHGPAGQPDLGQGVPAHPHRIPEPAQVRFRVALNACCEHMLIFK